MCKLSLERTGIFDRGRVSSFLRLIIFLRIRDRRFDISFDEPFIPFRANQFVVVSGESVGKFIAGTRLTANVRACVSVGSFQSIAGLGEL